jgi:hypothetical protein
MMRRSFLGGLLASAATLTTGLAFGGSYLDRAALLLHECHQTNEWLLSHLTDRELAAVAHDMAEARVKAARRMAVPKEIVAAHPHLLLTLENAERAAAGAAAGDLEHFMQYLRVSRDEEGLFRSLLAQLKLPLPAVK